MLVVDVTENPTSSVTGNVWLEGEETCEGILLSELHHVMVNHHLVSGVSSGTVPAIMRPTETVKRQDHVDANISV